MTTLGDRTPRHDSPLDWELDVEEIPMLLLLRHWVLIAGLGLGAIGLVVSLVGN